MIVISTDSTADLTKELIEKHNIKVIPLIVTLGSTDYLDDGVSVTEEKIFEFVKNTKVLPKTAARSIEDYSAYFKDLLAGGNEVIHISLSSALSSSYQNAVLSKEELKSDKLFVIDGKSLSTGTALLVLYAAKLKEDGLSAKDIFEKVTLQTQKTQASFVVDRLDYLYKGGRCSKFSFSLGSIMKIKPQLQLIDGKIVNVSKDIGPMKSVLKKYIDNTLKKYPNPIIERVFITHTKIDSEVLAEIVRYVKDKNIFKEVIVNEAGSVITSHCGEGTLGILYLYN